jgi:hypothetical protein
VTADSRIFNRRLQLLVMTMTSAITSDPSTSLFHRILRLWQSLPSYIDPDQFDPVILSPSPTAKQKEVSFVEYPQIELRNAASGLRKIIPEELIQPFLEFVKYYKVQAYHFPPPGDEQQTGPLEFSECNFRAIECPVTSTNLELPLRRIVVKIVSHDQGWSDCSEGQGTVLNSWTWFEIVLERQEHDKMVEVYRGWIQANLHARVDMTTFVLDLGVDHPVVAMARNKDVVSLWIRAQFQGWINYVEEISMWTFFVYEVEETEAQGKS